MKKKRLITAASKSNVNVKRKRKISKSRKQKWEEKQLHGYFKRPTGKIAHKNTDMDKKEKPQEKNC